MAIHPRKLSQIPRVGRATQSSLEFIERVCENLVKMALGEGDQEVARARALAHLAILEELVVRTKPTKEEENGDA